MATINRFKVFVKMKYQLYHRHGYAMHRTFTIQLKANSYVRDIAEEAAKKVHIRSDRILLKHGQKPLRHDLMMCDYNIQPNSTLNVSFLNQYDTLSKSFENALEKLENKYAEWATEEVIAWLQLIETGKFCDRKYLGMIKEIKKLEINGKSFKDLRNDCLLRMIGGNALSLTDRQLMIKNIDRVVNGENGKQQRTNCTICVAARIDSVFLPCGHQSMCFECYQKSKNRFRQCPICRNAVSNVVKTYLNGF